MVDRFNDSSGLDKNEELPFAKKALNDLYSAGGNNANWISAINKLVSGYSVESLTDDERSAYEKHKKNVKMTDLEWQALQESVAKAKEAKWKEFDKPVEISEQSGTTDRRGPTDNAIDQEENIPPAPGFPADSPETVPSVPAPTGKPDGAPPSPGGEPNKENSPDKKDSSSDKSGGRGGERGSSPDNPLYVAYSDGKRHVDLAQVISQG